MKVTWRILEGDVRERLADLPDGSVHCAVTSPPYWGLRDYGTGTWEGGDPDCAHRISGQVQDTKAKGAITAGVRPGADASACRDCGAVRIDSQLGLEPTPDEYVASMVAVFREVRRVLRDDGTLWLNLGDSYCADVRKGRTHMGEGKNSAHNVWINRQPVGLKPKDLVGIPWRVAFALQADGWYLRSDVIWAKPNPMPESVTDRPTKAHEYLFLLTKSARYFYDADAVKEQAVGANHHDLTGGRYAPPGQTPHTGSRQGPVEASRNRRSVWTIPTRPFPDAHFAVFPPELVEPCIRAGTSEAGCCASCGAPWVRRTERVDQGYDGSKYGERAVEATGGAKSGGTARSTLGSSGGQLTGKYETVGWESACGCGVEAVPCTVLDPFAGSGTTLLMANRLGRDGVGVELNPGYAAMIRRRLGGDIPLFSAEAE